MRQLVAVLLLILSHGKLAAEPVLELVYGDHPRQRLDLYRPANHAKPPALIVYVPGGAWVSGGKAQYASLGPAVTGHGHALAVLEYRLSGDGGVRFPAAVEDTAAALALLARRAGEWGIDVNRIFVVGHSAGAHTAGVIARDPKFEAAAKIVRGFVGISGIYDLPTLVKRWPGYRDWFVTAAFGPESEWKKASPTLLTRRSEKPWLLIHSKDDELVDIAQTEAFAKALGKAKTKVDTFNPQGLGHFEVIERLSRRGDATLARILKFVDGA